MVLSWSRKEPKAIFSFKNYSWPENCELMIICLDFFHLSTRYTVIYKLLPVDMSMQPVFKRYLRPEKEYLSFSLIYNNGERSLDLVSEQINLFSC